MSGAWGLLPVTFVLSLSSLVELDVVGTPFGRLSVQVRLETRAMIS